MAAEHFFCVWCLVCGVCVVCGVLSCVLWTLDIGSWTFGLRGKLEMGACGVSEEHYTAHVSGILYNVAAAALWLYCAESYAMNRRRK